MTMRVVREKTSLGQNSYLEPQSAHTYPQLYQPYVLKVSNTLYSLGLLRTFCVRRHPSEAENGKR